MGGPNGRRECRHDHGRVRQVSLDGQLRGWEAHLRDHLLRRQGRRDPQQEMAWRRAPAYSSKGRPVTILASAQDAAWVVAHHIDWMMEIARKYDTEMPPPQGR